MKADDAFRRMIAQQKILEKPEQIAANPKAFIANMPNVNRRDAEAHSKDWMKNFTNWQQFK